MTSFEEMTGYPLFIDFDGVICDSIDECFVSSWIAYHEGRENRPVSVRLADRVLFSRYRPFIRRGADYIVLQHCIDSGVSLGSQQEFDEAEASFGSDGMERLHERFYSARERLLSSSRDYWLSLNKLYAGLDIALTPPLDRWFIISTKKAEFIREILLSKGIDWELGRIFYSGTEKKIPFIEKVMKREGFERAVFVDDQIDHFKGGDGHRVICLLADWGYVKRDWLTSGTARVLSLAEFRRILRPDGRLP